MRHIHQIFSFILAFACTSLSYGQVSNVQFGLEFNSSDASYDMYIVIVEGQTNSNNDRIQFNSQVSFIVPTGEVLSVLENHNPFSNNENQDSVDPISWNIFNTVIAPAEDTNHDFVSISPQISQTSHYNDLNVGDRVTLFTVVLEGNTKKNALRLYENGVDKVITGSDFSNGFSLGGSDQLYSGVEKGSKESSINKHRE